MCRQVARHRRPGNPHSEYRCTGMNPAVTRRHGSQLKRQGVGGIAALDSY